METPEFIDNAFRLEPLAVQAISAETEGLSQYQLDTRLGEIRQRQIPGLKNMLKAALCAGDDEALTILTATAQERARDAVFRKAAREIVRNYSKIGEIRDWHL